MLNKTSVTFAAAALAALTGCSNQPTATEEDFGNSVYSMIQGQTLNPKAAEENRGKHADQGDGQRGEAIMEAYRGDVSSPEEASRDLVLDLGQLSGD